jgi:hypothetical protein
MGAVLIDRRAAVAPRVPPPTNDGGTLGSASESLPAGYCLLALLALPTL